MRKNEAIYNELKELNSPLAAISNENMFTVPEGYFDTISTDVMLAINHEYIIDELDIPVLNRNVPAGYFEGLAGEIMNKIKSESVETNSENEEPAILSGLRYKNVFRVPDGYFDTLSSDILAQLPRPAKVITMKPRPVFLRYAVAAAFTGIIGLSLFNMMNHKTRVEASTGNSLAFLDNAKDILKNNSFDAVMGSLDEDEIAGYLKSEGEDVNAALVASLTDEKNLPTEEAYFLDDKALDNFLTEQHISENNN